MLIFSRCSVNSSTKDVSTTTEKSIIVREEPKVQKSPIKVIHVTDTADSNSEQGAPIWMKIGRITDIRKKF